MADSNTTRQRAARKKIRVTFADGTVVCHKKVTLTMLDALRHIGVERFPEIDITVGDTRWVTQNVPAKFRTCNEPIEDDWYLITQSTTEQKYMQLKAIAMRLNLDMKVEIAEDLETDDVKARVSKAGSGKKDSKLAILFPDGYIMRGSSVQDTFKQCVKHLGVDIIKRKSIKWAGKPLVTSIQQYRNQVQLDEHTWLYIPATLKDCSKLLRVMSAMLGIKFQVGTADEFALNDKPLIEKQMPAELVREISAHQERSADKTYVQLTLFDNI